MFEDLHQDGLTGLYSECNDYQNSFYDHWVLPFLDLNPSPNPVLFPYGVRQRNSGTFFVNSAVQYTQLNQSNEDYSNISGLAVDFYHLPSNPILDYSNDVNPIGLPVTANTCVSEINDYIGVIHLPIGGKAPIINEFNGISQLLLSKNQEYEDLTIDETERLYILTEIDNLEPNNKQSIREMLMSFSPFLTTEILWEVADNTPSVINHPWLRDLMIANIESVTDELITYLTTKEYPLPSPFIQEIENAQGTIFTYKSELEGEISQLSALRSEYGNLLIMDTRHDTVYEGLDSIRYFYQLKNDLDADILTTMTYIDEKDFVMASSHVNYLKSNLDTYPEGYKREISEFITFMNFMIPILEIQGKVAELEDNEISYLKGIARNGLGFSKYYAENILCFFYDDCDQRIINIPSTKGYIPFPSESSVKAETKCLSVYPNPANDGVVVQVELEEFEGVSIAIIDIAGKVLTQTNLMLNTYIYNTNGISDGIYFVNLMIQGELVETKKLVVQH